MTFLAAMLFATVVSQAEPNVALEPLTGGLDRPVSITNAGDQRLFITEQSGRVRVWDGTQLLSEPFLDVRGLITSGGERGLLSIAFHPRYAENGLVYANYTDLEGHTAVVRYTRSASNPNRVDPSSALRILSIDQPYANHNGGQMQFGPDGMLYIGMGDGGSGNDPQNRAQNLGDLLGKMLRIDVDHGSPYAIPPSNPFTHHSGARGEIWSSGLRNPWRFSFDRMTGDLWIADVGQGNWEEVNFQPASSIGGENYGWRLMEGAHCYIPPSTTCNAGNALVVPVIEYDHRDGACSVTGGYVYRGLKYPRFRGTYIYADFCNGRISGATRHGDGRTTIRQLFDAPFTISTFGEDATGELYLADYTNGRILRITDTVPNDSRRRAVRH